MTSDSEQAAFLSGIIDHPDDDARRLVYADWLDEHDQPERAEIVRVQIKLASATGVERAQLLDRERQLVTEFGEGWGAGFRGAGIHRAILRRGFIGEVHSTASAFIRRGARWAERTPLQAVQLTAVAGRVGELAACPHLAAITGLTLFEEGLGDGIQDLVESPHAGGIREFRLGGRGLTPCGAEKVRCLQTPDVGLLARAVFREQLDSLEIANDDLSPQTVEKLFGVCPFPNLRTLVLYLSPGPDGARALAAGPALPSLERLALRATLIGDAEAVALLNSPRLSGLQSLDLLGNFVTPAGLARLAEIAMPPHLRFLGLALNPLAEVSAAVVVKLCERNPELVVELGGLNFPEPLKVELQQSVVAERLRFWKR